MNFLIFQCSQINQAACDIAFEVQREKRTSVAGGSTQSTIYNFNKIRNKEVVQEELKKGLAVLAKNNVDFIICLLYTSDAADE